MCPRNPGGRRNGTGWLRSFFFSLCSCRSHPHPTPPYATPRHPCLLCSLPFHNGLSRMRLASGATVLSRSTVKAAAGLDLAALRPKPSQFLKRTSITPPRTPLLPGVYFQALRERRWEPSGPQEKLLICQSHGGSVRRAFALLVRTPCFTFVLAGAGVKVTAGPPAPLALSGLIRLESIHLQTGKCWP